jgi:hypothetical protein
MLTSISKKSKLYTEAELIKMFNLQRLIGNNAHPVLSEWLTIDEVVLTSNEQEIFNAILEDAIPNILNWYEEDLKMQFIAFVLRLGHFKNTPRYHPYFERTLCATIEEHYLKVKTDFMLATGILNMPEQPYFHFQEYKRQLDPNGDPIGQLLMAMLIASELNKHTKPLYGCYVLGKFWNFVIFQNKTYCISKSYDCTESEKLLQIVGILRKFKNILETRLLD